MQTPATAPKPESQARPRKASPLQVAGVVLSGLIMVGSRKTWDKGGKGDRMTPRQIVAGAALGGILLIAALLILVRVVLALSAS